MEEIDEDKISSLPDDILEGILSLLPTKSVITTSVLSTRWRTLSTNHIIHTLNFVFDREFAENQSREEFINTVNALLNINTSLQVNKFHLYFNPDYAYKSLANDWIRYATERNVKELNLDFCRLTDVRHVFPEVFEIPGSLFDCASLTHLKLSRCVVNVPSLYTGLRLLKSLDLEYVRIAASELKNLLSNSPQIETLVINECGPLVSDQELFSSISLKCFTFYCWNQPMEHIVIHAPNLGVFSFSGRAGKSITLSEAPLLEAVIEVSERRGLECQEFYVQILSVISRVKLLTVYADYLPHHMPEGLVNFSNLEELRFLTGRGPGVNRADVYNFFAHCVCPLLASLSIELSPYPDESFYDDEKLKEEGCVEYIFHHLKRIEISNFQQMDCQIELLRYFLERCSRLESMILVAPKADYGDFEDEDAYVVVEKPFYLPNAPSTAQIILREHYLQNENPDKQPYNVCFGR